MLALRWWLWLHPVFYFPICLKEVVGVSFFVESLVEFQQFISLIELDLLSDDAEQVPLFCSKLLKYQRLQLAAHDVFMLWE